MDTIFRTYNYMFGSGIYVLIWLISIAYLFIRENKGRDAIIYPLVLVVLFFMNPFVIYIAARLFGVGEYSRIVWCALADIVIAIAATKFVYSRQTYRTKFLSFFIVCMVLIISGKSLLTDEYFSKATNRYKLSDETIAICEYLSQNHPEEKIIVDQQILVEIHQYNALIPMYYGRWDLTKYIEKAFESKNDIVIEQYLEKAIADDCTIIVLENNDFYNSELRKYGWIKETSVGTYNIYKYIGEHWILTNYADESGNQGMFYNAL